MKAARYGVLLIVTILFVLTACGTSQPAITPSANSPGSSSNQSVAVTSGATNTTPANTSEPTANQGKALPKETPAAISSNVTAEITRELALNYVSTKFGVTKESLTIYEENSLVLDLISQEKVDYFAIGQSYPSTVFAKLVVDSSGKVMDVHEYEKEVGERNKAIAGHMNLGLYTYLQTIGANDLVKIEIIASIHTELVDFIELRGFKITRIGDVQETRFIYAELPKYFILELAKRDEVFDMQQEPHYILP